MDMKNFKRKKVLSFTLAEILLSLVIVGIIAAILVPVLMTNINQKIWEAQGRALYNRVGQAMRAMPALNGYGGYSYTTANPYTGEVNVTLDTVAFDFLSNGLSKYLKMKQICQPEEIDKCGIVSEFTTAKNVKKQMPTKLSELNFMWSRYNHSDPAQVTSLDKKYLNPHYFVDTRPAAFETEGGESVLTFYNHECWPKWDNAPQKLVLKSGWSLHQQEIGMSFLDLGRWHGLPRMCSVMIYDVNGKKGPNKIYKDMGFIVAMYNVDPVVVSPRMYPDNIPNPDKLDMPPMVDGHVNYPRYFMPYNKIVRACKTFNKDSRPTTTEELIAISFLSNALFYSYDAQHYMSTRKHFRYWTSDAVGDDFAYVVEGYFTAIPMLRTEEEVEDDNTRGWSVKCVKRDTK